MGTVSISIKGKVVVSLPDAVFVPYGDRVYLNHRTRDLIKASLLVFVPYGDRVYLNGTENII